MMAAEVVAGERAVTGAMREAGIGLKSAWRLQITGAGLGTRLANSIRSQTFPRAGESLDAAALVWSKAPVIVGAHDTGPLIRSQNGFWLAIPLPAAGKSLRGGRITPGEWERRRGLRLHEGSGGGVALEDRARKGHRADLPAGAAGQASETAGSGAGRGSGFGQRAGADRGELGGGKELEMKRLVNPKRAMQTGRATLRETPRKICEMRSPRRSGVRFPPRPGPSSPPCPWA